MSDSEIIVLLALSLESLTVEEFELIRELLLQLEGK